MHWAREEQEEEINHKFRPDLLLCSLSWGERGGRKNEWATLGMQYIQLARKAELAQTEFHLCGGFIVFRTKLLYLPKNPQFPDAGKVH